MTDLPTGDAAPAAGAAQPPRVMGFSDLVLFYVVTGISLRWIATAAAAGPSSVAIWGIAWLCFYMPLALSVLELSSRYPDEGGLYVWSKHAFGDFAGYMSGFSYWTSNLPYFPAVLYFAASNALYIRGDRWVFLASKASYYIWFSLIALTLITVLNLVGLDIGKWLHNVGAFGMWIPAVIVMVMGVYAWHRFGAATTFTARAMIPHTQWKDMGLWATLIFAFGGCETASFIAGEIKNPRRAMPRALLSAGVLVAVCYIGGTICVLLALPSHQVNDLQGLMQAITATAGKVGWYAVIPVAAALIALSNLGSSGAYLAATARLPFVAGIDRFLPPAFGRLHPHWGTPYVALILQAAIGALFIFLAQAGTSVKGAYDILVSMGILTYFVPYLYLFAALFKLQTAPAGPEVIRVPGGVGVAKLVACVGFTTTLVTIVLSLIPPPDEPNKALAVVKIIGSSGVLLGTGAWFYHLKRRKRTNLSA